MKNVVWDAVLQNGHALRLNADMPKYKLKKSIDIQIDKSGVFFLPSGSELDLEEVEEAKEEPAYKPIFSDEEIEEEKRGIAEVAKIMNQQNGCKFCGGTGRIQKECPDYKGGMIHCAVYHFRACPNCR